MKHLFSPFNRACFWLFNFQGVTFLIFNYYNSFFDFELTDHVPFLSHLQQYLLATPLVFRLSLLALFGLYLLVLMKGFSNYLKYLWDEQNDN